LAIADHDARLREEMAASPEVPEAVGSERDGVSR
jgi:hypothetical protein